MQSTVQNDAPLTARDPSAWPRSSEALGAAVAALGSVLHGWVGAAVLVADPQGTLQLVAAGDHRLA